MQGTQERFSNSDVSKKETTTTESQTVSFHPKGRVRAKDVTVNKQLFGCPLQPNARRHKQHTVLRSLSKAHILDDGTYVG